MIASFMQPRQMQGMRYAMTGERGDSGGGLPGGHLARLMGHTGGPGQVQQMPQFNTGGQLPPQLMTGGQLPPMGMSGYPGQYPASSGGLARMFSTYRGF